MQELIGVSNPCQYNTNPEIDINTCSCKFIKWRCFMKRILLHIGYPKTGTTTIQNTLFYNLHNSGSINFLGKARYVDDISINKQHNLINSFINDRISIDDLKIDLLPDKLNVYSNEGSAKVSELDRAKKFFKIFQPDINDVRLLVTLRNQPDLIYSLFVDQHRPGKRIEHRFSRYL